MGDYSWTWCAPEGTRRGPKGPKGPGRRGNNYCQGRLKRDEAET